MIFPIIVGLQCSVNFLLYRKVTQSHTYTHTQTHTHTHTHTHSFALIILHHKWLDVVPSAIQQDLIAYPLQRQHFASINPRFPVHPTPSSSSSLATTSLQQEFLREFNKLAIESTWTRKRPKWPSKFWNKNEGRLSLLDICGIESIVYA